MNFTTDTAAFSIDINGQAIDVLALPDASVRAMLSRGLTHFFGSEVAARVKARADKFAEDNKAAGTVWTADEIAQEKKNVLGDFVTKLLEGTVGSRAVGITVDPVETIKARLARKSVEDTLRANGIKLPKKDEPVTFPNGATKTMADMIASRMVATNKATGKVFGDEFQREAEQTVKKQAKAKADAEANAAAAPSKTADDLGL
jgi:hypothetical protein